MRLHQGQVRLFLLCSLSAISIAWASQAAGQETLLGIVGRDFILLGADSSVSQGVALTASNLDKIAPLVDPRPSSSSSSSMESNTNAPHQQQCIVAAVAGNAAMSDRLIGLLQAQATIREYEAGVGCDVQFVSSSSSSVSSKLSKWNKDHDDGADRTAVEEAGLTVQGMAHLARSQLSSIRPNANVCLLIAGMMYVEEEDVHEEQPVAFWSHQVQQQARHAWKAVVGTVNEADPLTRVTEPSSSTPTSSSSSLHPHLYWLDELGSLQQIQYGAHGLGSNFCLSVLDQGFRADMTLEDATQLMQDCFHQLRTRYLINSPRPPCIKVVDANGIRLIARTVGGDII